MLTCTREQYLHLVQGSTRNELLEHDDSLTVTWYHHDIMIARVTHWTNSNHWHYQANEMFV